MTANRMKSRLSLAAVTVLIAILAGATGAHAATPPVKLILSSHFGAEVNETTKGNVCTVASGDECQPAKQSSLPGGFFDLDAVAGAANGNIYISENPPNSRVQELTASGEFVLMFGKEVNKTTKGDICTAASKNVCQAGVEGAAAGQFYAPQGVTVDPVSGDVYVAEHAVSEVDGNKVSGERVQKFTANGEFILEIGKEVNETTKGNLCTAEEEKTGVKCGGPVGYAFGASTDEHGSFGFYPASESGNPVVVSEEHDILYVGDKGRIQEFEPDGEWVGEIPLAANRIVGDVAVDNQTGDVYIVYHGEGNVNDAENVIHKFDEEGKELEPIEITPRETGGKIEIIGIALDSSGHLAVNTEEFEAGGTYGDEPELGLLYEAATNKLITEFSVPRETDVHGIGFSGEGHLYTGSPERNEIRSYVPEPVGELLTAPESCVPGPEHETDVTLDCNLNGEVDAWGVRDTRVFFQWGRTPSLGEVTSPPSVVANVKSEGEEESLVRVSAPIAGVRPNEHFYDQLAGEDENVKTPELLTSATLSFVTPIVPAVILGAPSASFVTSSSVVMFSELNPENASTEDFFEYGQGAALANCPRGVGRGEACEGVASTAVGEASTYGAVGSTLEATGLQPATVYHYRLAAADENTAKTEKDQSPPGPEGTFTTAPAPVPVAVTGLSSAVGTSSATVSGAVDPDGQPATYAFELGVYEGALTRYGVVFSGSAGAGAVPVTESLGLTGLQPGTTYAYRIVVASGYGTATGEAVTFTTAGLPAVIAVPTPLPMLAVPAITFPTETKVGTTTKKATPKKCAKGKQLSHGRCIKAKARKTKKAKKPSTKEM